MAAGQKALVRVPPSPLSNGSRVMEQQEFKAEHSSHLVQWLMNPWSFTLLYSFMWSTLHFTNGLLCMNPKMSVSNF